MEPTPFGAANARRAAAGAAVQVAQARAALPLATDPGHIHVLRARIERPGASLGEIAASLGMSKAAYWGRLRRAIDGPRTSTRAPVVRPAVVRQRSRSANAIRIGMGRRTTR